MSDEVRPRGLASGKTLETPANKRSVMSTQSARRRAHQRRPESGPSGVEREERAESPAVQTELEARGVEGADTGVENADTEWNARSEHETGDQPVYRDHRALADRSQYAFDEQSFAFDVEVKKTPADVARARQAEFIAQQRERAKSAHLEAQERFEQAQQNYKALQERKAQLTRDRARGMKSGTESAQNSQISTVSNVPCYIPRASFDNSALVR